jgi:hypothetical protein
MKEEFNKDIGNLKKKESNKNPGNIKFLKSIESTVENHSSRLEPVEVRITGLKDKTDIKEKNEEFLDKRLKIYEKNMPEPCDSIKRPNL